MTKRSRELVAPQALWNEILAEVDKRSDAITTELDAAVEEFPQLVGAFKLLLAYVSYSNRVRSLPVGVGGVGPLPSHFQGASAACST